MISENGGFAARQRLGKIGEIMTCGEAQQPVPVLVPLQVGVEQADVGKNPGLANHGGASVSWISTSMPSVYP